MGASYRLVLLTAYSRGSMKPHIVAPLFYTAAMGAIVAYLHHVQGANYGSAEFIQGAVLGVGPLAVVSFAYCRWQRSALPDAAPRGWRIMLLPMVPTAAMMLYALATRAQASWAFAAPLLLAIVVGVGEELVYRKVVLSSLLRTTSPRRAIVLSAVMFSALHVVNVFGGQSGVDTTRQLISTFVAGLAYAVMYLYTRRIAWLIVAHAMWDYVGLSGAVAPGSPLASVALVVPILEVIAMVVILRRHKEFMSTEAPA